MRLKQLTLNNGASSLALLAAFAATPAWAGLPLPTGGSVVSGSAQIGAPNGTGVTINQSSANAIINWQSFDVAAGKIIVFNQPDTASATLNRVTGTTASTIAGQIVANGSVYLINPNGIQITRSGIVQVGRGFVASTLDIADADFLAGKGSFVGMGGAVRNDGTITTRTGGFVGLLGGSVSNTGLIVAPAGQVTVGAGTMATLDVNGGGFLQVALPSGSALSSDGSLTALTGAQARNAVRNIVNLPDSINALAVAGRSGDVTLGGTISVDSESGDAGHIHILGDSVTVNGTLTARALGATGNGGLIETSGNSVDFTGIHVDTTAARGNTGNWLVDPTDLYIDAAAASAIDNALATTSVTLQTNASGNPTATNVSGATNTTGTGSGDIIVNSALSWSSNKTLTLNAYNAIYVNAPITISGAGGLSLTTAMDTSTVSGMSIAKLYFANPGTGFTGSVSYTGSGGSLNINAHAYTLLYSISDLLTIDSNATPTSVDGFAVPVAVGYYALAKPITSSSTYHDAIVGAFGGIFSGTFEGLGNTITGLSIDGTNVQNSTAATNYSYDPMGLFGQVGGTIRDIGLVNATITDPNTKSYNKGALVGILDGYNSSAVVVNSYTTGTVSIAATPSAYSQGGESMPSTGGLIGAVDGDGGRAAVVNSYSSATVSSPDRNVGGLVGIVNSDGGNVVVIDSHATGNVSNTFAGGSITLTGGLVGCVGADCSNVISGASPASTFGVKILSSYATGNVSAQGSTNQNSPAMAGGLIGEAYSNADGDAFQNNYATGNISITTGGTLYSYAGGFGGVFYRALPVSQGGGGATTAAIDVSGNYATGTVVGRTVNGFAYNNDFNPTSGYAGVTSASHNYWNTTTSGISSADSMGASGLTTSALQSASLATLGFSSPPWSVSPGSNPSLTSYFSVPNSGVSSTTPLTYTVASATSTYGTLATLGLVTLAGSPANVGGTVSLYTTNSSGTLSGQVTLANTLSAGTYYEGVSALTGSAASSYTIATSGNTIGTLTISPLAVTISGSQVYNGSRTINGANLSVTNKVGSDTVTIAGSIANGISSPNASGTAQNLTTLSGLTLNNSNYTLSGGSGTVTITPASLAVTGSKTYDGSASLTTAQLSVAGGAATGETVTLTSGSGTAASPNAGAASGNLSGLAIGVSGGQALASNYSLPTAGILTIGKASLTITPLAQSATYGTAYTLQTGLNSGYSQTGLVGGETISSVTLTANGTGSSTGTTSTTSVGSGYTIAASNATGATLSNYTITYGSPATLTVNQAIVTVTYGVANAQSTFGTLATLGSVTFTGVTVADSGNVSGTVGLFSGSTPIALSTVTPVGNYLEQVTGLTGSAASNYTISPTGNTPGTLTISPLALTGTIASSSSVYGSTLNPGAVTFTNLVGGASNVSPTVSVATAGNTSTSGNFKAGIYTGAQYIASLTGPDAGNYSFAGLTGDYTVSQLALAGTLGAGTSVYGAALAPGAASVTGVVGGDVVTPGTVGIATVGHTSTSGHLAAGSYTGIESVSTIGGADAGNYSFAGLTGDYTVSQLALAGTLGAGTSVYGAALAPGAASVTGVVGGDVVTPGTVGIATVGHTSTSGHLAAGSYTGIESVSTIGGADAGNYSFAGLTGDYTVSPLALAGTLGAGTSVYGAALAPGAASVTGVVGGDVVTPGTVGIATVGHTSTSGHLAAGSYTGIESVSTIGGADAGNYSFAGLTGDYTVSQLALAGTLGAGTSVYGAALAPGAASVTGVVGGDVVTPGTVGIATVGHTSTSGHLAAGSYTGIESVSTIGGADAGNYSFAGLTGDYTVSQLALAGTLGAGTSVYGAALAPGAASVTGVVGGDVVTPGTVGIATAGHTSTSGHLAAGSYTGIESVSTIGGADAGNYSFAGLTGDYTVDKAVLTISADGGETSIYGAAIPILTFAQRGLLSGDGISGTLATTAAQGSHVGSYAITQGSLTAGGNYAINYSGATFAITPATLIYAADPTSRFTFTGTPLFTGTVSGFVPGDTLATATTGSLAFTTSATPSSPPGLYPILGSGLAANNGDYVFVQAAANSTALTINPSAITPGSPTISNGIHASYSQSNLSDIEGALSRNDVNPADITDKTGSGSNSSSDSGDHADGKGSGFCVSYAPDKPRLCTAQ